MLRRHGSERTVTRAALVLTIGLVGCGGAAPHKPVSNQPAQADCNNMIKELQTTGRHVTFGYGPRFAALQLARGARADARIIQVTRRRLTQASGELAATQALVRTEAGFARLSRQINVSVSTLPPRKDYRDYDSLLSSAFRTCAATVKGSD